MAVRNLYNDGAGDSMVTQLLLYPITHDLAKLLHCSSERGQGQEERH